MFNSWFNKSLTSLRSGDDRGSRKRKTKARHAHRSRLGFEVLETRNLLAALTVTTSLDELGGDTSSIDALVSEPGPEGTISLREAILASNNTPGANLITFDPVTSGTPIRLIQGSLSISNALTITGLGEANTMVNGEGQWLIFNIGPAGLINDVGPVTLDGLTLTGGNGLDAGAIRSQLRGGAVLTVSNCMIEDNRASGFGSVSAGGINSFSAVTVVGSTITRNSSARGSGGIFAQGAVTVVDSTISGNLAGSNAHGGGIFSRSVAAMSISNSSITSNVAFGGGGGIETRGNVTITGSTIAHNSVNSNWGGGGIYGGRGVTVTVISSTISDNFAGFGGGIFAESAVVVSNSTISGNILAEQGGGIYSSGNVTVQNSTISGNSANVGGGIYNVGDATIGSSIVAGNSDNEGSPDLAESSSITVTYSLIGDSSGTSLMPSPAGDIDDEGNLIGAAGVPIDPLLGPLADNGGPTQTMALLVGSPAIGGGDPNTAALPPFDQRGPGFTRVSSGRADMGAYEVQRSLFTPTVSVSNSGGTFNGNPFPAVATVAGEDGVATTSLDGVIPTLTYFNGPTATGPALSSAPIHAGTYTAVADFAGSAQYTSASASASFTIDKATPIFRTQPSLTIVLGSSANLGGQISLSPLVPSGSVAITLGGTTYFAAIQQDGTFVVSLPAGTVAAGSYVINYFYRGDADFTSASATQTLVVLSAQQDALLIMDQVTALVIAGTLDNSTALTAKLDSAIASLNKGNTTAGVNQLSAFIKQVNALVKSGKLTDADAHMLINEIDAAIAAALAGAV